MSKQNTSSNNQQTTSNSSSANNPVTHAANQVSGGINYALKQIFSIPSSNPKGEDKKSK